MGKLNFMGRPAAGWALRTVGKNAPNVHKKVCACCKKPFHEAKRPKAAVAVQHHPDGTVTYDRFVCRPCVRAAGPSGELPRAGKKTAKKR